MATSLSAVCLSACKAGSGAPRNRQPIASEPTPSGNAGAGGGSADADSFGNPNVAGSSIGAAGSGLCGGLSCVDASANAVPDNDNDGFSVAEGDCDDFAELVNPGAYDVPNNGIDDDCVGGDALTDTCDDSLELAADDPMAAARAIELCATSDENSKHWGVLSARWTTPDGQGAPGSAAMHGLLPSFGTAFQPRGGKTFLAISSGSARAPGQAGYTRDCSDQFETPAARFPEGFDGTSSTCPADTQATEIRDTIALELRVRMPTNASALSFDSAFFTDEYPHFICSPFNDFFHVFVDPMRMGSSADGNVVFDLDGNAVSVNNSLLRACDPGEFGGKRFDCPLGTAPLQGTGFEDCPGIADVFGGIFGGLFGAPNRPAYGASTGWLATEFSVMPGEVVTIRFAIWDSGDGSLDSLSLIDHVQFRLRDAPPPPEKPMTTPIVVL